MSVQTADLFKAIERHFDEVVQGTTDLGKSLWKSFLELHVADCAFFFSSLDKEDAEKLFKCLPQTKRVPIFNELNDSLKVFILSCLSDQDKATILNQIPIDELTDLFYSLSDQDLKKYLTLVSTKDRINVLSLMKFDPESAGGIMNTDVLTLMHNFTVEKSVHILQRLQPRKELHQQIYVTDQANMLVGYIHLEDLVLKTPNDRLNSFMRRVELTVAANEDREEVAKKMIHYNLMIVPVTGENNYFLGVIPSDTLVDIIEQEASEDVYRLSAMTPIKYPYFDTSFFRILYERSYILIILLLAQSLSSMIIKRYEVTLAGFLMYFITMLISTGGNSSSQTSALVIQGLASGQITSSNVGRFLRREIMMAFLMAGILGFFSFIRVYLTYGQLLGSIAVSISLALIVLVSVLLGSGIPLLLKRINMDPVYAAGPFLATIMDILGLLIYCYVSKLILS